MPRFYTKTCKHPQCNKTYRSVYKTAVKNSMCKHLANAHKIFKKDKKYHICNVDDCNRKVFINSFYLKYHQRRKHGIYTNEERTSYKYEVKCDICDKIFGSNVSHCSAKYNMLIHKVNTHQDFDDLISAGIKFYFCEKGCGQVYRIPAHLQKHELACTGKKKIQKFKCKLCRKGFETERCLYFHKLKVHDTITKVKNWNQIKKKVTYNIESIVDVRKNGNHDEYKIEGTTTWVCERKLRDNGYGHHIDKFNNDVKEHLDFLTTCIKQEL